MQKSCAQKKCFPRMLAEEVKTPSRRAVNMKHNRNQQSDVESHLRQVDFAEPAKHSANRSCDAMYLPVLFVDKPGDQAREKNKSRRFSKEPQWTINGITESL